MPRGTMSDPRIQAIFEALRQANPAPRSELHFGNPFELLVAVILSAQATDVGVNKATPALFAVAPDARAMAALGEEGIAGRIRTIGLYKTKAKHLAAMSRLLLERHDGQVPRDRAALEALPGVGRKTASVVLNVAFGEATIAVDTHVFRVSHRLELVTAGDKTPQAVEARLLTVVPGPFLHGAHHWLILHGRHVCQARKPRCGACLLRTYCNYWKTLGEAS